jgi:hypothetical protein
MLPIILGISILRIEEDSSKQGFVLISIIHGLKNWSIIKSYPNISKQFFLANLFSFFLTDRRLICIIYSIFSMIP